MSHCDTLSHKLKVKELQIKKGVPSCTRVLEEGVGRCSMSVIMLPASALVNLNEFGREN